MADTAAMELDTSPPPAVFDFSRPSKKRNYIRRARASSSDPEPTPSSTAPIPTTNPTTAHTTLPFHPPPPGPSDSEPDQSTANLAEILLRRRKKLSRLKQGLDIAEIVPKVSREADDEGPTPDTDAVTDVAEQELAAVVNRFTHQTGQVLDVDKHMVAYIESQMEKRRRLQNPDTDTPTRSTSSYPHSTSPSPTATATSNAFWQPTRPSDRGATLGKLHEVDLGEENKLLNIHRTQAATRHLEDPLLPPSSSHPPPPSTTTQPPHPHPHPRRRRRRNSQDLHRDRLVEEVLKESKLQVDLYDDPAAHSSSPHPSDEEGAADDRIAEKFRREFLDALMSRRRRRGNYQKAKKKDDAKKPRGPKLGGSRSARAAMRESQLAASGGAGVGGGGGGPAGGAPGGAGRR